MSLVITIGRQNGSGGHQVAEKLCEKLGFALYDNNLLEMVAQEGQVLLLDLRVAQRDASCVVGDVQLHALRERL